MKKEKGHYTAIFSDENHISLDANQLEHNFEILEINRHHFTVFYKNRSFPVELVKRNLESKEFKIKVGNFNFEFNVKEPSDQLIESLVIKPKESTHLKEIRAPMPGLILEIAVQEGQEIFLHDKLCIIEAMKMENLIKSHSNGKIKSCFVKQGDSVEKNQLLILLD